MKILHLTLDFGDGGAEKFIVHLSNEQVKNGHNVTVCSFWDLKDNDYFQKQLDNNIVFLSLGKKIGFDFSILVKLKRLLQNIAPDIIHTHRSTINYIIPLLLLKRLKVIHTLHNDAFKETNQKLLRLIKDFFFIKGFIKPVTISKESQNSFNKAYKSSSNLILNGIPKPMPTSKITEAKEFINKLKKTSDTIIVTNIARLSYQKNHILLINVIKKLITDGIDIYLLIIGRIDNPDNKLLKLSNERIMFLGSIPNATDYLFCSDAFCLSSIYEGMPISLIEALSTKCIPIVTPAGGVKNMIQNNYNGFISKDYEFDSYYNSFKSYIETNSTIKKRIKENCENDFYKKYHISNVYKEYLKLYNEK